MLVEYCIVWVGVILVKCVVRIFVFNMGVGEVGRLMSCVVFVVFLVYVFKVFCELVSVFFRWLVLYKIDLYVWFMLWVVCGFLRWVMFFEVFWFCICIFYVDGFYC